MHLEEIKEVTPEASQSPVVLKANMIPVVPNKAKVVAVVAQAPAASPVKVEKQEIGAKPRVLGGSISPHAQGVIE